MQVMVGENALIAVRQYIRNDAYLNLRSTTTSSDQATAYDDTIKVLLLRSLFDATLHPVGTVRSSLLSHHVEARCVRFTRPTLGDSHRILKFFLCKMSAGMTG